MCGNYRLESDKIDYQKGSPPRVRELLWAQYLSYGKKRITPACAGITVQSGFYTCAVRDHPRVCGNYSYDFHISFFR